MPNSENSRNKTKQKTKWEGSASCTMQSFSFVGPQRERTTNHTKINKILRQSLAKHNHNSYVTHSSEKAINFTEYLKETTRTMSDDTAEPKVDPIDRIRQYLEKKLHLNEQNNEEGSSSGGKRPNQVSASLLY